MKAVTETKSAPKSVKFTREVLCDVTGAPVEDSLHIYNKSTGNQETTVLFAPEDGELEVVLHGTNVSEEDINAYLQERGLQIDATVFLQNIPIREIPKYVTKLIKQFEKEQAAQQVKQFWQFEVYPTGRFDEEGAAERFYRYDLLDDKSDREPREWYMFRFVGEEGLQLVLHGRADDDESVSEQMKSYCVEQGFDSAISVIDVASFEPEVGLEKHFKTQIRAWKKEQKNAKSFTDITE